MKCALIATVFNEADNISRWWDCLRAQTVSPDEMVIVDGGSTDGTWEKLQQLASTAPMPVRLEQRRCNIAEGRNRAIRLTDSEIIASTDAGSFPEPDWFAQITEPLQADAKVDVVGGRNLFTIENDFQRYLSQFEGEGETADELTGEFHPSSRNTAFRRQAWADAGGYPEWLTLTAEDALFTRGLHRIGKNFLHNPRAVVQWQMRGDARSYFKMLYRYGFGSAEAGIHSGYFLRRLAIALFPPLLLLSKRRFSDLSFRYQKNMMSAAGWVAGLAKGRRPPKEWKKIDGTWLAPEAQKTHLKNQLHENTALQ